MCRVMEYDAKNGESNKPKSNFDTDFDGGKVGRTETKQDNYGSGGG